MALNRGFGRGADRRTRPVGRVARHSALAADHGILKCIDPTEGDPVEQVAVPLVIKAKARNVAGRGLGRYIHEAIIRICNDIVPGAIMIGIATCRVEVAAVCNVILEPESRDGRGVAVVYSSPVLRRVGNAVMGVAVRPFLHAERVVHEHEDVRRDRVGDVRRDARIIGTQVGAPQGS